VIKLLVMLALFFLGNWATVQKQLIDAGPR
jgi:hypothetical protein